MPGIRQARPDSHGQDEVPGLRLSVSDRFVGHVRDRPEASPREADVRNLPYLMTLLLLISAGSTWIEGTSNERLWFGVGLMFGLMISVFIWMAGRER